MNAPADERAGAIAFTDIVGFTELTDLQGDDVALALVERQLAIVRDELPPHARVVKELGDGLLLWFDDAVEAVGTSVRLQQRFAQATTDEVPMWVRIGIHWGAPKRRGDDIIGRDVNLASRIAGLAGPGEVLCTDRVVAAVAAARSSVPAAMAPAQMAPVAAGANGAPPGDRPATSPGELTFRSLGSMFVKGVAEAVPVYRVESTCASAG